MDCEVLKSIKKIILEELRPQIVTTYYMNNSETVEIPSIHRRLNGKLIDETCVFYPDNTSEVVGSYNDHFEIAENFIKDLVNEY